MKALISVYDKTGIVDFARDIQKTGMDLISTGGTHQVLKDAGLAVRQVSEVTGSPEILDGRVKTLHPTVHGGILALRDNPEHVSELSNRNIDTIDLVAVNLYPFAATISRPGITLGDALENIDIGGPTMIRAAAKNFPFVVVVVDPSDYSWVSERIADGGLTLEERQILAQKAFQHVAFYDTIIAGYLRQNDQTNLFPQEFTLAYRKLQGLRYGENPHQNGAFYVDPSITFSGLAGGTQILGQELSLCNIYDMSAALETIREFIDRPAAVVIKHATPSGFAFGTTLSEALEKAIHADPTSAFGGIIGLSQTMDVKTAQVVANFRELESSNIDAIVTPGIDEEAVDILRKTRRRMVVYSVPALGPLPFGDMNIKQVPGGILYQQSNITPIDRSSWLVVTKKSPTTEQLEGMEEAWLLMRHIRSNTILVWDEKNGVTLGIGSGQVSRVGSARLALDQSGEGAKGAILASDSFFPFQDTVELAARYGISAIVQQGGSINDQASIDAADDAGIVMVLTGERAFWH